MTHRSLSQTLALQPPLQLRLIDGAAESWQLLRRRVGAWRAERALRRNAERAERQFAALSLHTLQDIGAPHSLIAQRRWQQEQQAAVQAVSLHQGW